MKPTPTVACCQAPFYALFVICTRDCLTFGPAAGESSVNPGRLHCEVKRDSLALDALNRSICIEELVESEKDFRDFLCLRVEKIA